jgi:hypothetical protein
MDDSKVQPENDNPQDLRPVHELKTSSKIPDCLPGSPPLENQTGSSPERPHRRKGLTGGYYWFPTPASNGVTWTVVSCHDVGKGSDVGHTRLWPLVLEQLAATWSRDPAVLKRRLGQSYTGLSRGRVTRWEKLYYLSHGNDAPISYPEWQSLVIERFHLQLGRIKVAFDEHESQITEDAEAFYTLFNRVRPK